MVVKLYAVSQQGGKLHTTHKGGATAVHRCMLMLECVFVCVLYGMGHQIKTLVTLELH